jgi:hypothetical protein
MRALHRGGFLTVLLLLAVVLFTGQSAEASHFRYAKVDWCLSENPSTPGLATFSVEIAERRFANQMVGETFSEIFRFGDGTNTAVTLTVTEVHVEEGWFLAKGTVTHQYVGPFPVQPEAGFDSCCRIDGFGGNDFLNNRSDGNFRVLANVNPFAEGECSPQVSLPPIVYVRGNIGDTFTIPVPFSHPEPVNCRFATDAEAGGGPNPTGMTINPNTCVITWTPTSGNPSAFWTTQVRVEEANRIPLLSTAVDFLIGLDNTAPVCRVDRIDQGPPTRIHIFIQDVQSGLAAINVLLLTNATVNIPAFAPGFTGSLIVVGTKINESQAARIQLKVTDVAGNMIECDPVLTQEARGTGKPESHVFPGIPAEEHVVTLLNGTPGLTQVELDVNGTKFTMSGLRDGEERTIDVGSAVVPGTDSTFTLTTHGKPGGTAAVMIWDGNAE